MTELLAWFNPTRWLLLAGMAFALTFAYFAWADHIGDVREAEVMARYAKQAKTVDAKRDAVAPQIAAKQEQQQVRIRTVTQTIIKEVPVYVQADACPLPGGFRVLHDAAAHGEVPDPARIADAAPAAAQDVAETLAANYGTYQEVAARLLGLQEWVRAQQALKP